jgi:hypothetical protein
MWGRRTSLPLAAVFGVAALLPAGCGGGDSAPIVPVGGTSGASGAGGAQPLSKSAFINQADNICGEANAALQSLNASTDAKLQATQELQITRSELESLQSLAPPNQDRSTINGFLSALKREVSALGRQKAAVEQGGDTAAAATAASTDKSEAQTAAEDYGFNDCGKGAGAPSTSAGTGTGGVTTTTTPVPVAPTTTTPTTPAPAAPTGGTGGGAPSGGGTGGNTGGGTGGGTGTGGTGGGVTP